MSHEQMFFYPSKDSKYEFHNHNMEVGIVSLYKHMKITTQPTNVAY